MGHLLLSYSKVFKKMLALSKLPVAWSKCEVTLGRVAQLNHCIPQFCYQCYSAESIQTEKQPEARY